jgi:hypothetical protein
LASLTDYVKENRQRVAESQEAREAREKTARGPDMTAGRRNVDFEEPAGKEEIRLI